jgi:hypothetical protein
MLEHASAHELGPQLVCVLEEDGGHADGEGGIAVVLPIVHEEAFGREPLQGLCGAEIGCRVGFAHAPVTGNERPLDESG